MDGAVPPSTHVAIRRLAGSVNGVLDVEKLRIRKSGTGLLMDIHIEVDETMSVRQGHEIAHRVKDRLVGSEYAVVDVVVHVEPGSIRGDAAN